MTKTFLTTVSLMILAVCLGGCASPHQITAGSTGQCMNVENHGYPVAGTPLKMKTCDPWKNQEWSLSSSGTISGVGGFCVDVQGGQPTDGSPINYVPCDGRASQSWSLVHGAIVGLGGKCIDIVGGTPENGAPLALATCNGSPSQQWQIH